MLSLVAAACADDTVKVASDVHGATQQENPYTSSGDSTPQCYEWAADGQCVVNPAYMHSSCKYSCWEWYEFRAKKHPEYTKIDKTMDCHSWANSGECSKNPTFMKSNCAESCKDKGYEEVEPVPQAAATKKKKRRRRKKAHE